MAFGLQNLIVGDSHQVVTGRRIVKVCNDLSHIKKFPVPFVSLTHIDVPFLQPKSTSNK